MVYKKFKDYKLEVITMLFQHETGQKIFKFIDDLEKNCKITPTQAQQLNRMINGCEMYRLIDNPGQEPGLLIMIFDHKITASYDSWKKEAYLE